MFLVHIVRIENATICKDPDVTIFCEYDSSNDTLNITLKDGKKYTYKESMVVSESFHLNMGFIL